MTEVSITAMGAIIVALLGFVVTCVTKIKELKVLLRKERIIVGIRGEVPEALKNFPDYTKLKDAILSGDKIVCLHCRTLSYALRKCDFVSTDCKNLDPKIHDPSSDFWPTLVAGAN